MRKYCLLFFILIALVSRAQEMGVAHGALKHVENFPSKLVEPRNIHIWLPDGYSDKEKYAVLYMQDGQMLFDAQTTWNKQAWEVDDTASKLMAEKKTRKFIVVGISSVAKTRHCDYFPQKPFNALPPNIQEWLYGMETEGVPVFAKKVSSDDYLKFIVTELKPYIDTNFPTKKDVANTFIAGSDMGALVSLYAICEYPDIFGGAACLSTHWPGAIGGGVKDVIPNAFVAYLKTKLPAPATHKIYFDYGTEGQDAVYEPLQDEVDKVMKSKGYTSKNWTTKKFQYGEHSENSWALRLDVPLKFLLAAPVVKK